MLSIFISLAVLQFPDNRDNRRGHPHDNRNRYCAFPISIMDELRSTERKMDCTVREWERGGGRCRWLTIDGAAEMLIKNVES